MHSSQLALELLYVHPDIARAAELHCLTINQQVGTRLRPHPVTDGPSQVGQGVAQVGTRRGLWTLWPEQLHQRFAPLRQV